MARVVRVYETGFSEAPRIEEVELPLPSKGEVQIRIHALGLNRAEVMLRRGQYFAQPRFPARAGYEAAGMVAAIGKGVTGFKIGDAISQPYMATASNNPNRDLNANKEVTDFWRTDYEKDTALNPLHFSASS
jgi:NADPH:quinone reductase-like Zn-dependent oxidoreductase